MIWMFFYNAVFIPLFCLAVGILALFKQKVRRAIRGRRGLFESLAAKTAQLGSGPRLWVHSSSMGEFEQAKPIISALRQQMPGIKILVTFFSPSGYEHSRTYPLADVISYIPFDSSKNARRFIDLVKPTVAVMVRYDIWPNHIWELHRRKIPILIANATMRRSTPRRLPLLKPFHQRVYNAIDRILTVSQSDVVVFRALGITRPLLEAIGDTRYDQVAARSAEARKRSIIPSGILQGKRSSSRAAPGRKMKPSSCRHFCRCARSCRTCCSSSCRTNRQSTISRNSNGSCKNRSGLFDFPH